MIIAAILNSTQQPGRVFVTSFRPRNFLQSWLFLSHIILSQTRKDSIEDREVDNPSEKIDFADLVKDVKSVADVFPSESDRMTSHKLGLA